jgi:hypothetical protein
VHAEALGGLPADERAAFVAALGKLVDGSAPATGPVRRARGR